MISQLTSQDEEGATSIPPASDFTRQFSRSPHPYNCSGSVHLHSDPPAHTENEVPFLHHVPKWSRSSRASSDSGTEADDESTGMLRGLPAPPLRPRKGLRSYSDDIEGNLDSWISVFQPWPSLLGRSASKSSRRNSGEDAELQETGLRRQKLHHERRIEVLRRLSETVFLLSLGSVVLLPESVREIAWDWRKELLTHGLLVIGLYATYPLCVSTWSCCRGHTRLARFLTFSIPSKFDPAPLLYPILIPVYVSLSLTQHSQALVMPNILLSLSALPTPVIPLHGWNHGFSISHWMVTLVPILVSEYLSSDNAWPKPLSLRGLDAETLILLFPLQQALLPTLDFLLGSSLLPAELQLLTTALINLFVFAASPQAEIMKALLWLGGMCVFVFCRRVLHWEVALARIPSWKFRRSPKGSRNPKRILNVIDNKLCERLSRAGSHEDDTSDSDSPSNYRRTPKKGKTMHNSSTGPLDGRGGVVLPELSTAPLGNLTAEEAPRRDAPVRGQRRHTISTFEVAAQSELVRTTPGGRRKRTIPLDIASFLSMTPAQAQVRKWVYALYTYAAIVVIVMGPVRKHVGERALNGAEPFGWALGYLFGNVSWFRFWIIMMNLEGWIRLPARIDRGGEFSGPFGACWMESIRQYAFGEANTRLLISAYCIIVLLTGLIIVFRLSSTVEVDTRRKVFHGMMVMMFLPTIYIDPAFCALALTLVLAIFLLLDLFRASQLPPISRPLTYFLAPYVDGRDHRGPVIVSHVFLLIGCSIPLWLSLADIPRAGDDPWMGWEVVTRNVSMVSGVICVGMGDAAASLTGRRFGRLKWFWGGGKSLEGSVAFALAVFSGLVAARAWIGFGGWPVSGSSEDGLVGKYSTWPWTLGKAMVAAGGASTTEAILTGCNDNVVVPVVLWLLVRGLGI